MRNQKKIFGTYGYYACDPFHEGEPPVDGTEYLNNVGKTISELYASFDEKYTWVMQAMVNKRGYSQCCFSRTFADT